ncbi:MAG: hypothetical protein FGM24_00825 [Candidatus Kapabacteria bacterium]|nr:hypothetical protein [Candidatus Kapabacteria bacterium]
MARIMNKNQHSPKPRGWLRWFVGALSVMAVPLYGQEAVSRQVVAAGGTQAAQAGTAYLSTTIGQVIAGPVRIQASEQLHQGFWLPIEVPTSVRPESAGTEPSSTVNFPNPFSTATAIRIDAPVAGPVTIRIRDMVGGLVRTLTSTVQTGEQAMITFDGTTDTGVLLASGTYFYEVVARSASGERMRLVNRMDIVR